MPTLWMESVPHSVGWTEPQIKFLWLHLDKGHKWDKESDKTRKETCLLSLAPWFLFWQMQHD